MQKLKTVLQDVFALDLRSLALFRILFGFLLFIDVVYRMPYAYDFYSDMGVMPREALISKFMNIWETSIFLISGQTAIIMVLMAVIAVSALCLSIGFYTRTAALVCWILTVSMHTRIGIILHGGDDVFRVLLFWMQFLPISACYSVDSYLNKTKIENFKHVSWGSAGILIQLLSVYFFSGVLKLHPIWHTDGTGVYYALSLDQFATPLGSYLTQFHLLTRIMSFMTLLLEVGGPILFLIPIPFLKRRTLVAFSFIGFHAGLILTMELGLFPWLCMAAWTMTLPESFWNKTRMGEFLPVKRISQYFTRWKISAPAPRLRISRVLQIIAAVYIVLITAWNITEVEALNLEKSYGLRLVMSVTEMYQRWSMFAPYPRRDDGWYVMEATQFNGTVFDPFQDDHKLNYLKPKNVAATFKNSMWRKYLTNIWLKNYFDYRVYFGRYLCRTWNMQQTEKSKKIDTIYIYYMAEITPPPFADLKEVAAKELVWRHYCYDKPNDWVD